MIITNVHNLPEPVFKALSHDDYTKGSSNRSVTELIKSPRESILLRENDDMVQEDCSMRTWSVLGSALHKIFENSGYDETQHIAEERVSVMLHGWEISGAIDNQILNDDNSRSLKDYKCVGVMAVMFDKPEWEQQLNFYAWLVRHAYGVVIRDLEIIAILRDWKKSELRRQGRDYPKSPVMVLPQKLWSEKEQDEFVNYRVRLHQKVEFDRLTGVDLPHCTDKERWAKKTTFAVKKGKNIKAVRVLNSEEEAQEYIANKNLDTKLHWVETRPGASTKCEDGWCLAAPFCNQFKAMKGELDV